MQCLGTVVCWYQEINQLVLAKTNKFQLLLNVTNIVLTIATINSALTILTADFDVTKIKLHLRQRMRIFFYKNPTYYSDYHACICILSLEMYVYIDGYQTLFNELYN